MMTWNVIIWFGFDFMSQKSTNDGVIENKNHKIKPIELKDRISNL